MAIDLGTEFRRPVTIALAAAALIGWIVVIAGVACGCIRAHAGAKVDRNRQGLLRKRSFVQHRCRPAGSLDKAVTQTCCETGSIGNAFLQHAGPARSTLCTISHITFGQRKYLRSLDPAGYAKFMNYAQQQSLIVPAFGVLLRQALEPLDKGVQDHRPPPNQRRQSRLLCLMSRQRQKFATSLSLIGEGGTS